MAETKSQKGEWESRCRRLLKSELIRRGISYAELREKLLTVGVEITEVNIRSKLSRGTFSAAFLLACFVAMGASEIRLD